MSYEMLNIPAFKGCKNCGKCCGVIPVSQEDVKTIKKYIKEHDIKPNPAKNTPECPFRDEKNKKCMIYPVRPLMCRTYRCDDPRQIEIQLLRYMEYLPPANEALILNWVNWEEEEE